MHIDDIVVRALRLLMHMKVEFNVMDEEIERKFMFDAITYSKRKLSVVALLENACSQLEESTKGSYVNIIELKRIYS